MAYDVEDIRDCPADWDAGIVAGVLDGVDVWLWCAPRNSVFGCYRFDDNPELDKSNKEGLRELAWHTSEFCRMDGPWIGEGTPLIKQCCQTCEYWNAGGECRNPNSDFLNSNTGADHVCKAWW